MFSEKTTTPTIPQQASTHASTLNVNFLGALVFTIGCSVLVVNAVLSFLPFCSNLALSDNVIYVEGALSLMSNALFLMGSAFTFTQILNSKRAERYEEYLKESKSDDSVSRVYGKSVPQKNSPYSSTEHLKPTDNKLAPASADGTNDFDENPPPRYDSAFPSMVDLRPDWKEVKDAAPDDIASEDGEKSTTLPEPAYASQEDLPEYNQSDNRANASSISDTLCDSTEDLTTAYKAAEEVSSDSSAAKNGGSQQSRSNSTTGSTENLKHSYQDHNPDPDPDPETTPDTNDNEYRYIPSSAELWARCTHEIGFLATAVFFCCSLLYFFSSIASIVEIARTGAISRWIRCPQLIAAVGFASASITLMLQMQEQWWLPAWNSIRWHVNLWNLIGSVGFVACACFGLVKDVSWAEFQFGMSYLWGSWAFLIGSVMQWYKSRGKSVTERAKEWG